MNCTKIGKTRFYDISAFDSMGDDIKALKRLNIPFKLETTDNGLLRLDYWMEVPRDMLEALKE